MEVFRQMQPKIIKKAAFHVIGYSIVANLQEINEKKLGKQTLAKLKENAANIKHKSSDDIYLIQLYPMKEDFNANKDAFTQIIGYEVSEIEDIPEEAIHHHVPAHEYVLYTHQGLESDLHKTYDYLYGEWLEENNYWPVGYDFERWDERYKPEDPSNEIDLYVAVEKAE